MYTISKEMSSAATQRFTAIDRIEVQEMAYGERIENRALRKQTEIFTGGDIDEFEWLTGFGWFSSILRTCNYGKLLSDGAIQRRCNPSGHAFCKVRYREIYKSPYRLMTAKGIIRYRPYVYGSSKT